MIDTLKTIAKKIPLATSCYRKSKRTVRRMLENSKYHACGKKIMPEAMGNDYIAKLIKSGKPAAIGKIGSSELQVIYKFHCANGMNVDWRYNKLIAEELPFSTNKNTFLVCICL